MQPRRRTFAIAAAVALASAVLLVYAVFKPRPAALRIGAPMTDTATVRGLEAEVSRLARVADTVLARIDAGAVRADLDGMRLALDSARTRLSVIRADSALGARTVVPRSVPGVLGSLGSGTRLSTHVQRLDTELARGVTQSARIDAFLVRASDAASESADEVHAAIRRIERIVADMQARSAEQDADERGGLPLELLAGLLGMISSTSTMVLAWRSDRRDSLKLRLELERLRRELDRVSAGS